MLAYQIIAGFSEIKSEIRNQYNLTENLEDFQLWFSLEQDIIYAHDYQEHEKCIALAIYKRPENTWRITFSGGDYGKQVITYATNKFEIEDIDEAFYDLYRSHGYIAFR